jgi:iron complex outermembrane receptor protein
MKRKAAFSRLPLVLALSAAFPPVHAQTIVAAASSDRVVVTGTRVETSAFDTPAAIDTIDTERITDGQPRVNLSEALATVPGVVAANRQNYAQDLQISSRGFGARSAFGVRGVRLVTDGIPATMPDGQGQAATFNLDVADHIEVLRGPFSALYGNHSGGVIQLFTREGSGAPSIEGSFEAGSYDTWKASLTAQGKPGAIGYLVNASRFDTNGYRDHSAATRDVGFAKLTSDVSDDVRMMLVANSLTQHDTQDPLGLTWAAAQKDPRSADPAATAFNTRKSIDHLQGGGTWEHRFGTDRLQVAAYYGQREVEQYQAIPKAAQVDPRSPGGVIAFTRDFAGVGLRWIDTHELVGGTLKLTAGIDLDRSQDDRQGYENFVGSTLGVQGKLRRDETDTVTSTDPYVQAAWQAGRWSVFAGLHYSDVRFEVSDRYIAPGNGDDSGSVDYSHLTPVGGVSFRLTPDVNLYASAASGFETPTFNELAYSGKGGGFNFDLAAARSTHFELGSKARLGDDMRLNLALLQARTHDELVVDQASGGRTSYKNAATTLRQGVELSFDARLLERLTTHVAFTDLRAIYDESFRSGNTGTLVEAGKHLPGVAQATAFADLAWEFPIGVTAALEGVYRGKVFVEDSNTEPAAPGYAQFNLRLTATQQTGALRINEFVRVDNLFDRNVIGSVIVGDTNKRYYEPGPGCNAMAGVSGEYRF